MAKSMLGEINAYIDMKMKEFMKDIKKFIAKGTPSKNLNDSTPTGTWIGTVAEYAAIVSPDPDTLYYTY